MRPCFYPSSQGDPAKVSHSVLENRPDLGRTDRLGRAIQCSRRAKRTQGGASLCPGLSPFAPLGRTDREQARGQRREGTAKQPENFGAILSSYPRITMHVASRKTRGLSPVFLKVRPCFYPSSQGDPAYVSLTVLENRSELR